MRSFEPHPLAEERRSSARILIELLLTNQQPAILSGHSEELLRILLGKITESDGKYKTRYQSSEALIDRNQLRHDHVYTRKRLVADLLAARPENVSQILERAIACTVTADEHSRLSMYDEEYDGWKRYAKAGIVVIDTTTGESLKTDATLRNLHY